MDKKDTENKAKKFFSKINKKLDALLDENDISKEDIKKGINERVEELKHSRDEVKKEFKKIREENKDDVEKVEKFVDDAKVELRKAWSGIFSSEKKDEKPKKSDSGKKDKE